MLGDEGRFECLASGSCSTNTFENMINSTCDQCHPNCAECIGTHFENCTRCNNRPGYLILHQKIMMQDCLIAVILKVLQ